MNSNSRMNLGDREIKYVDFWMPMTPEKPIPARSNTINGHGSQLGRENWQLAGFSSGYVQQISNFIRAGRHFGQIDETGASRSLAENRMMNQIEAGSYSQALQNESVGWDGNSFVDLLTMPNASPVTYPNTIPSTSLCMTQRPLIPNFQPRESSSTPCSNSNMLSTDGFPIPYHPHYDLNSSSVEIYGTSTVPNSFQFAPVTPQPKKLENQHIANANLPQEKGSDEQRETQQNLVLSIDNVPEEHSSGQLLQNILDQSSAFISTPLEEPKAAVISTSIEEPKDIGTVSDQVIDLNKTPQQKTPKRRKHRPKVIVEGKPKKTSKAAATDPQQKETEKRKYVRKKSQQESETQHPDSIGEIVDAIEKPKEKRKYVRKKDLKEPVIQGAEHTGESASATAGTAAPSCKKALNFDSENVNGEGKRNLVELLNKKTETSILSTGCQDAESIKTTNMVCRTQSSFQMSQQSNLMLEKSKATSNFTSSINLIPDNNISTSGRNEAGTSYNCKSIETNGRVICQFNPQSVPEYSPYLTESRVSKREYCQVEQTSHGTVNPLGQEILHTHDYHLSSPISTAVCSESQKKRKIENGIQINIDGMLPSVTAVKYSRGRTSSNDVNSSASASQRNREILNSYLESNYIKRRDNNGSNRLPVDWYTPSMASEEDLSKQYMLTGHSCVERTGETLASTMVDKLASINTFVTHHMFPPTPITGSQPGDKLQPTPCNINVSMNEAVMPTESQSGPSTKDKMQQPRTGILKVRLSPGKRREQQAKHNSPVTIEEITCQMERLNLSETNGEKQNALVLYKRDGVLVPYEGSGFIKKRKPRPKVDLDPETDRVWKLLMWKEGTEELEQTDEGKKKWWEEERRVFRGRIDSFIAKMHLVQGDRRFSKWKGSVVDSVIGVFLTQNVSDHLSSSAFMSLAARFPLKPIIETACGRDGTIILVEEPDPWMPNLTGKSNPHKKLLHRPFYSYISPTPNKSAEHQRHSETSCKVKTSNVQAQSHSPDEEVLSSQDSFDSSIIQSNGVRSYSGSNSEAEDPTNGCNSNKNYSTCSTDLLQVENTTSFEEFYSHVTGRSLIAGAFRHEHNQPAYIENSQQWPRLERLHDSPNRSSAFNQRISNDPPMQIPTVPSNNGQLYTTVQSGALEVESLDLYREESTSSWQASTSRSSKEKDASCTSEQVAKGAESVVRNTSPEYGSARYQETLMVDPHNFLSKQFLCEQVSAQPHHGSPPHEFNKPFHLKSQSIAKPVNFADVQTNRQHVSNIPKLTGKVFDVEARIYMVGNKETRSENKLVESNSNDQLDFTNNANLNKATIKGRKEKGKANNEDWDSLRKQVLANGGRKERSKDAMDSLDYETMRCASVNEISAAIKERGMNNLLAERIKEFLNRLVTEHGSIDLEWLRDIPPDKAKDYLLSIRGLGLKSVECVRLLTLHHLAFPVDTNVGRIAVRLGWVPLQPLPESLQLHLLELYPVLESIQKYLWPRLCNLDQKTLYELHYQMITFGKVFCTKNRPNCNACPMRAECRHFASAFASARLALPGPEEKSIVTQSVPLTMERGPGIVINPMPLPPPNNSLKRVGSDIISCIPIIEEPATPEQQQSEVIHSDIEDVFDEDPDEIPTIKLNMEELSVNVQNYMQSNMELQECNMSNALVALNPEAASIPTPKLKNVSRLRTEHQVYELPDSHPLLNGMDKREPDDPSPYLLAIWTPGETADSIQPPERRCQSQGEPDKLCNEETCFPCNSIREANSQIVRGTLLIPCRTAMRGSFPLNGTYFQVNEMFADHASSLNPIAVPRAWIWNLPRRTVYFGTSVSTIFKGLSTEGIQYCFWKGFVCVRGFDQKTRAPRPLMARLHFPASKLAKTKNEKK